MGISPIPNCAQMGHEIWKVWVQKPLRKECHRDDFYKNLCLRTFCKKKKNSNTKFHETTTTRLHVDTTSRTGGRSFHAQYSPPPRNGRLIILGFKHFLLLQKKM